MRVHQYDAIIAAMKPHCGDECDVTNDVIGDFTSRHGGFISSHVTGQCDGRSCPVLIRAQRGERLSVTLWNFNVVAVTHDSTQSRQPVDTCLKSVH